MWSNLHVQTEDIQTFQWNSGVQETSLQTDTDREIHKTFAVVQESPFRDELNIFLRSNCRNLPLHTICLCQMSASNNCSDVSIKQRWLTLRRNFTINQLELLELTSKDTLRQTGSVLQFREYLFLAECRRYIVQPRWYFCSSGGAWKQRMIQRSKTLTIDVK